MAFWQDLYFVDRREYDLSIQILRDAINRARLERSERLAALKRLIGYID